MDTQSHNDTDHVDRNSDHYIPRRRSEIHRPWNNLYRRDQVCILNQHTLMNNIWDLFYYIIIIFTKATHKADDSPSINVCHQHPSSKKT